MVTMHDAKQSGCGARVQGDVKLLYLGACSPVPHFLLHGIIVRLFFCFLLITCLLLALPVLAIFDTLAAAYTERRKYKHVRTVNTRNRKDRLVQQEQDTQKSHSPCLTLRCLHAYQHSTAQVLFTKHSLHGFDHAGCFACSSSAATSIVSV